MAYEFYLGVDVPGDEQATTLSLIEKETDLGETHETPTYHIRDLRELGDAEDTDDAADFVQDLIADSPYTGRTILVVNRTHERGLELLQALEERGLSPVGIVVTGGGDAASQEGSGLSTSGGGSEEGQLLVSERSLVERLDGLYHDGRLELPQENTEQVDAIAEGLQSYRVAVDDAGEGYLPDETGEKRAAAHSRYVLSAALACYIGEEHDFDPTQHLTGDVPTTGEAKRMLRPDIDS